MEYLRHLALKHLPGFSYHTITFPTLPQSFMEYLRNLASDLSVVQGDFDEFASPEHKVGWGKSSM